MFVSLSLFLLQTYLHTPAWAQSTIQKFRVCEQISLSVHQVFPLSHQIFPTDLNITPPKSKGSISLSDMSKLHKKAGDIFDPLYICVCVCGRVVRIFDYRPWDPGLNLTLNVNLSGRWVLEVFDPGRQYPCMCQLWKMPKNYTLSWHKSCE